MLIDKKKLFSLSTKIIFFIFLFVLVPIAVDGFALDAGMMALDAISEKTGPLMTLFMGSYFFFAISLMGLWISTTLLQAVIDISPEALTVMGGNASAMVQAGWSFTVGIGNMLLLIAFVVIALATILGYENYHLKKLLPRLVVVAFLMNFTLLFVGLGIDVSNFLFNSVAKQFSEDGGNILYNAIKPLLTLGGEINLKIFGLFTSIVVALLVPYLNVAIQVGWILFFPTQILPIIIQLLVYGMIMFLMTGTFLFYFVVFVARIFIIQILAILGPLAFFSLIFSETQKWWKKWLEYLIQWLSVGVIFIFLMYVGLALAPLTSSLIEPAAEDAPAFISKLLSSNLIAHLILLIYFMVILSVVKSFIPDLAKAIVAQGTALIKAAVPYAGAIGSGGKKYYQHQMSESKPFQDMMSDWSKSIPTTPGGGNVWERAKSFALRRIGTRLGPEIREAEKKSANEFADKLKGASPEKMANAYRSAMGGTAGVEKLGAILAAKEAGVVTEFLEGLKDVLTSNEFDQIYKKAESSGLKSDLKRALPVHFIEHETRGLSGANKEQKIKELVLGNLKGDKMEKAAPQIVDAINKGTTEQQSLGHQFMKAIMESQDTSYLKNFIKGSSGVSGVKVADEYLGAWAAAAGRNPNNPEHLYNALKEINPQMAKEIRTRPGNILLNVKPPTP